MIDDDFIRKNSTFLQSCLLVLLCAVLFFIMLHVIFTEHEKDMAPCKPICNMTHQGYELREWYFLKGKEYCHCTLYKCISKTPNYCMEYEKVEREVIYHDDT